MFRSHPNRIISRYLIKRDIIPPCFYYNFYEKFHNWLGGDYFWNDETFYIITVSCGYSNQD